MDFLKNLYSYISEAENNLDALPEDVMKELQKNIKTGAKDLNAKWSNALQLVHKAYEVSGVQRPTPDMPNAWKQYEQNLHYAVTQLSHFRGLKGDWRMSSSIFRESLEVKNTKQFKVVINHSNYSDSHIVEANSLDEVINSIEKKNKKINLETVIEKNEAEATLTFFEYGIRLNLKIFISEK